MLGLGIGIPRISRVSIAIGDTYQGGLVFYLDGSGGGLISAPSDQAASSAQWGCKGTIITGADGTAIGTGNQNTIDIEAECTTSGIAADICANLSLNGYTDWFLPSKDELDAMYDNLKAAGLGSFAAYSYWSSSEAGANTAWRQTFYNGGQYASTKETSLHVRAIRAF